METKQKAVVALFITLGVLVGFIMGTAFMYGAIVAGAGHIAEKMRIEQVTIGLNETALAQAAVEQIKAQGLAPV